MKDGEWREGSGAPPAASEGMLEGGASHEGIEPGARVDAPPQRVTPKPLRLFDEPPVLAGEPVARDPRAHAMWPERVARAAMPVYSIVDDEGDAISAEHVRLRDASKTLPARDVSRRHAALLAPIEPADPAAASRYPSVGRRSMVLAKRSQLSPSQRAAANRRPAPREDDGRGYVTYTVDARKGGSV